jgi:hypothetical protein
MIETPIMIGLKETADLEALREFANQRKNWIDCTAVAKGKSKVAGDRKRHVVKIPSGIPTRTWRVVYSVDLDKDLGPIKHMSMTLAGAPGRAPNPHGMQFVAEPLGLIPPYDYIGPHPNELDDAIHIFQALEAKGREALKDGPKLDGFTR